MDGPCGVIALLPTLPVGYGVMVLYAYLFFSPPTFAAASEPGVPYLTALLPVVVVIPVQAWELKPAS